MSKKNIIQHLRLTTSMKEELKKISEVTGIKQSDLIRFMLNNSLMRIRADCNGDYSKLTFALKHI